MAYDDFARELSEFHNCARIFKPMTGFMASRFTIARKPSAVSANEPETDLLSKPEPKVADPAEEAAKIGMYGKMTRKVENFYPTRLLCKRFNVKPPAHSQPDTEAGTGSGARNREEDPRPMDDVETSSRSPTVDVKMIEGAPAGTVPPAPVPEPAINPDKNEAVEGKTAHDEVLRAIFGDSDSE
jgi:G patch domain-containing protein 1